MIRAITELDKPVVCGLNGIAAGVGMSVALACDLVVATESAALTLAFTKIGLMPDGGATATVAASVGRARAMRLALLSDLITAREAYDAGLVSHVFADADYAEGLGKIVRRLSTRRTPGLRRHQEGGQRRHPRRARRGLPARARRPVPAAAHRGRRRGDEGLRREAPPGVQGPTESEAARLSGQGKPTDSAEPALEADVRGV